MASRDSVALLDWMASPPPSASIPRAGRPSYGGSFSSFGGSSGPSDWTFQPNSKSTVAPATFPEKIQFQTPFSSSGEAGAGGYQSPPAGTGTDPLSALQQGIADFFGGGQNMNMANAMARLQEAPVVVGRSFADAVVGGAVGLVAGKQAGETAGDIAQVPFDSYLNAMTAISDVAAPMLDALPNWYRDSTLGDRAKVYRAMASGRPLDLGPLGVGAFLMTGEFGATGPGGSSREMAQAWNRVAAMVTPDAAKQRDFLMAASDLPPSVKDAIRRSPNLSDDALEKLLNEAPEGRQWTYAQGLTGILRSLIAPAIIYGGEAIAGFRAAGYLGKQVGLAGIPTAFPKAVPLVGGRGPMTAAGRISTALAGTGAATLAVTTVADALARTQGNQALLDWSNTVFNEHPISDNPHVQLITSFSVNPFAALGLAKRGTIRLAYGAGDITLGKALGARYARLVTSDDMLYGALGKMYGVTPETAKGYIGTWFKSRGVAADHVVEFASDDVMARLPSETRAELQAAFQNPIQRVRHVLEIYAEDIIDTITKHPDRLAARMRMASDYHRFRTFDPEQMLRVYADYGGVKAATYQARQTMDAVVGYQDVLHQPAISDMRASLDQFPPEPTTPIPNAWIDDFNVKYPSSGEYFGTTFRPGQALTRADIEEGLIRAETDLRSLGRTNPVKVATGSDPVLRPNASPAEWSAALGTTDDVVAAVSEAPTAASAEVLRPFLVRQAGLDDAAVAAMTPEDVWAAANDHVSTVSEPWVRQGKAIAAAEAEMERLRARYAEIQQTDPAYRNEKGEITGASPAGDEAASIGRRMAELDDLIHAAQEPLVPYSSRVKFATREVRSTQTRRAQEQAAGRKVAAQTALEELSVIDGAAQAMLPKANWRDYVSRMRSGAWGWAGGLPPVPDKLLGRLEDYLRGYGKAGTANSLHELGDEALWGVVTAHYHPGSPFYKTLTVSQRRMIENVARGKTVGATLDEAAQAWETQAGKLKIEGGGAANLNDRFLAELGDLAERHDDILDGATPYALRRTASMYVPDAAMEAVQTERTLVYDPIFEVTGHPANLASLRVALDAGDSTTAAGIIRNDPILKHEATRLADEVGIARSDFIADPANVAALRTLIPADFEVAPLGQTVARTPLDQAVLGGDYPGVAKLVDDLGLAQGRLQPHPPIKNVALADGKRIIGRPALKPSTKYLRSMDAAGVDGHTLLDGAILMAEENRIGRDVLSILNRGYAGPGTEPRTVGYLVQLLKEIENGNATNSGLGPEMLAKGQELADRLLDHAVHQGQREGFRKGILGPGVDIRLLPEAEQAELHRLLDRGDILIDPSDPLGLQYGLKKRPKDAVTWEFEEARRIADETGVPGLGEEFLTSHYQPFEQRVLGAKVRQAFNLVFGPLHNIDIAIKSEAEFIGRSARLGVAADDATAIWTAWREQSTNSRGAQIRRWLRGDTKIIGVEKGDNPLYASPRNIPNGALEETAQQVLAERYAKGGMPEQYRSVEFSHLFRQSTSEVLRTLDDSRFTLGQMLGSAYGKVTTNYAVTTLYYLFRFGLDIRFHAMNVLEPHFLGAGRAGLLPDVADMKPHLGYTEEYLRNLSRDALNDTGFPFSISRSQHAYRTFRKQQQPALLDRIKGIGAEDPVLMKKALLELADPSLHLDAELPATIRMMGDTPEKWLASLDDWHGKVLNSSNVDATIDDALADALRETPALAEVYGQLAAVNKRLWSDTRGAFFGNPARSRIERVLNSYLLYWPLSYQIKSTKWLMRVLFDRAGGLKTNAGGAFMLDQVMALHNEHLRDDPEYAAWFETHPTLAFTAQMLFPISWDSIGVSLSPGLRNLFFGRSKQVAEVGPIYTVNEWGPKLMGEVYSMVGDLPGMDWAYRSIVGRVPPEGAAPIEQFIGDTLRFGQ